MGGEGRRREEKEKEGMRGGREEIQTKYTTVTFLPFRLTSLPLLSWPLPSLSQPYVPMSTVHYLHRRPTFTIPSNLSVGNSAATVDCSGYKRSLGLNSELLSPLMTEVGFRLRPKSPIHALAEC